MSGGLFPAVPARPMEAAPRDGRILRLLVEYSGEDARHPLDDASEAWTIGSNGFDNDGVDEWRLAGWCWSHDHFTEGRGRVIGWLPFHGEEAPQAEDEVCYFITECGQSPEKLTLTEVHSAINGIFDDAASDGCDEDIGALTVWRAVPVSKAVEVDHRRAVPCEACCGGELAEEIEEGLGGECCPVCDGNGQVSSDDPQEAWTSPFDEIREYVMRPPLPPLPPPSDPGGL